MNTTTSDIDILKSKHKKQAYQQTPQPRDSPQHNRSTSWLISTLVQAGLIRAVRRRGGETRRSRPG